MIWYPFFSLFSFLLDLISKALSFISSVVLPSFDLTPFYNNLLIINSYFPLITVLSVILLFFAFEISILAYHSFRAVIRLFWKA